MKGEQLNILLIEDNMAHAKLITRCLESNRVANHLYHVSDGEQALDYIFHRNAYSDQEKYPTPHLVLLDLRLPKIDGLEVLKQIRMGKEMSKLPVVILTTSAAEKDQAKAYKHHANSYLVKPVDYEKFQAMMDDLGYYWLAWNQYPWS
jgi:CheY-like chemotaxis protein